MPKKYNFSSYQEIPKHIEDYILQCSGELDIIDIPLEEINDFLNGVEEYENALSDNELDEELDEELDAMFVYYPNKNKITVH